MSRCWELTLAALRLHLATVAWPRYELRLIDTGRRQCVATRYWTAAQILAPATVRFLRARNRHGCDVYFRPHAGAENAGYLLLDFDDGPCPLAALRTAGHTPCVVIETSPGHQQAWIRVSTGSLEPGWATAMARQLARRYGADPASAEWRHLGRLAGFTNRKPARLQSNGLSPWVRVVWHCIGALATSAYSLPNPPPRADARPVPNEFPAPGGPSLYRQCLDAMRLLDRFPNPDWSVADYRVARSLLLRGMEPARVVAILRQQSPDFPRSHPKPEDYLWRTVQSAEANLIGRTDFSRAPIPPRRG